MAEGPVRKLICGSGEPAHFAESSAKQLRRSSEVVNWTPMPLNRHSISSRPMRALDALRTYEKPGGLSSLRDIQVREFDMGRGGFERRAGEDLLPTGSPTQPPSAMSGRAGRTSGSLYEPGITGDPNLPAGYGATNKYGDVVYSTQGSASDQALALAHERLHSSLSPKLMPLRELRADLRVAAYKHSELVRYLEEALAESYAQLSVNGVAGLPTGIRFPIANGYVQLDRVIKEAAVGTVAVGGVTYGVYVLTDSLENE